MVYTEQEYLKKSERERIMLNIVFSKIYNKNEYQDNIHHTPADSKEPYDSVVCRFLNGIIKKNHIWEAKIRDANYNEILFEKIKYNSLKKISKRYEEGATTDIFYISTHPNGTYVFNITHIEKEGKLEWIKQEHNRSTVEKWRGKVEKELIYLPIELAKFIDVKVSDIDRVEKEIEESKKPKQKKPIGFSLDELF
jgi:hypothetical protein